MRFDVVTLFPELFAPFLESGVTRRAYDSRQVDVRLWQLRDHAEGNYKRVDDRPFGGGPGMVMMAAPLARCLAAIRAERQDTAPVVLFTPVGERLDHAGVEAPALAQGVEAVRDQAVSVLSRLGFPRFEDVGERFDPTRHEAISEVDTDAEPGTVVGVVRPGYGSREVVLRPAAVVVARGGGV